MPQLLLPSPFGALRRHGGSAPGNDLGLDAVASQRVWGVLDDVAIVPCLEGPGDGRALHEMPRMTAAGEPTWRIVAGCQECLAQIRQPMLTSSRRSGAKKRKRKKARQVVRLAG